MPAAPFAGGLIELVLDRAVVPRRKKMDTTVETNRCGHGVRHVESTQFNATLVDTKFENLQQGNGRGLRHGNEHKFVDIYSHVARGTFDAFMFGTIERKSRAFEQLYRVDGQAREIEDLGDGTLTFGELKAAAAGNDLLLRQHELMTRVRKLKLAHLTVQQNVRTLLHQAELADNQAAAAAARAERLQDFAHHSRADLTKVDLSRVAEDACPAPRGGHNSALSRYHAAGWSAPRVSIRIDDTDPGRQLALRFDYYPLWAEPLPGKIRRRGPAAVQAWAEAMVAAWVAGLDQEIAHTSVRAHDAQQRAQDARHAAAGADITEPAELIAARAELADVDKAISAAVAADSRTAQAA